MITEDYVSYEVAKLLKEKGFDEYCRYFYDCDTPDNGYLSNKKYGEYFHNSKVYDWRNLAACPTHQMAMKWLRNKGIYIQIRRNINTYLYGAIMLKDGSDIYATIPSELETYEETVEAALKYSLENLI